MAKESNDRSKTSKTARVMNLLSKKQDPTPETGETPAAAASASVPPILGSLAPDAAVSGEIKNALEAALEEEMAPAPGTSAPAAPAAQPAAPVAQAAPPAAEPPATQAEPLPAEPEPTPLQDETPAAPAESHVFPEFSEPAAPAVPTASPVIAPAPVQQETAGYINVMQVLVAEKAEKYVKLMGMCTCQRCMDDIMALTLNHLPPKYVVMSEGDRIPKLTFYEGQYSSEITAQLLKACKIISDRPHHSR